MKIFNYLLTSLIPISLLCSEPAEDIETQQEELREDASLGDDFGEADLLSPEEDIYTDDVDVDLPFDHYMPPAETPECEEVNELPLTVDLKNPVFVRGVISTEEGGIITAPGIRIQARKIEYINKIENGVRVQKIKAEDDLMMEYGERVFVGSRLEYDFVNKKGTLWDGKTFVDMWFLGGSQIELKEDGTFYIYNAYITTCETTENAWEIKAREVKITQEYLLSASNIRFQVLKIPIFWIPSFKSNLKVFADPPVRYKLVWDKGIGPRLTMRYRVYSWENLNVFFRLDYRLKRGLGAAVESEYFSDDGRTTFVTRSYGAHDKSFPDEKGNKRYRLQGLYHTHSKDEKTTLHMTYDKLSDSRMVGDFRSDDFEINTLRRTQLVATHERENAFFNLTVQPRLNRFDSIEQELPLTSVALRPFKIGHSNIISSNYFNAGYLDYVYATDLTKSFKELGLRSSTHAARLETHNQLYYPLNIGPVTLTPSAGLIGIFYSNNPEHHAVGQGIFTYGAHAQTHLLRHFTKYRHLIEPYATFQGLTNPTAGLDDHFIFDIYDGYHRLNQLKLGIRNTLTPRRKSPFSPTIVTDLYTYGFFWNHQFSQVFPKYYLNIGWLRPSYAIRSAIAWNNLERVWDFTNISGEWTINEYIALGLEFRHRSRFDWRKADHENFIIDVSQPIPELLDSPISDGRDTLLGRMFVRLTPKWSCQLQTRNGWGRKNEPRYNAGKFDLFYMLTCSWRLRLSYERMPNDNRFSGTISMVK